MHAKNIHNRAVNIAEVMKNKDIRYSYRYLYKHNGEGFYIKGKKCIPEAEFEKMYPIEIKSPPPKGSNPDKSKNWIHDAKSY
jgi:hypothetical protein